MNRDLQDASGSISLKKQYSSPGDKTTMNDHDACIILNMLTGLGGLSAWKRRGAYIKALLKSYGNYSAILESDMASLSRIESVVPDVFYFLL